MLCAQIGCVSRPTWTSNTLVVSYPHCVQSHSRPQLMFVYRFVYMFVYMFVCVRQVTGRLSAASVTGRSGTGATCAVTRARTARRAPTSARCAARASRAATRCRRTCAPNTTAATARCRSCVCCSRRRIRSVNGASLGAEGGMWRESGDGVHRASHWDC